MIPLFANRWLVAVPPIWLLGVGALITLAVLALVWAILLVVAPRAAAEARTSLRDGFAGPMAWLLLTLAGVAVAGAPLVPMGQIWRSLVRLTSADRVSVSTTVPVPLPLMPLLVRPPEMLSGTVSVPCSTESVVVTLAVAVVAVAVAARFFHFFTETICFGYY